jgi:hypothetical protein
MVSLVMTITCKYSMKLMKKTTMDRWSWKQKPKDKGISVYS